MTKLSALLDPESAAIITGAIDTVTSPRRGGPRFVDPDEAARADALIADGRTNTQVALDALVDIVELATRAASDRAALAAQWGGCPIPGCDRPAPLGVPAQRLEPKISSVIRRHRRPSNPLAP